MYKQFSVDVNVDQVKSIEPTGIPPLNPTNKIIPYVIREGSESFFINDKSIPLFKPPLYIQHYNSNNSLAGFQDPEYLAPYSLEQGEVVDWYVCFVKDKEEAAKGWMDGLLRMDAAGHR